MAVIEVGCRYCGQTDQVYRHGKDGAGHPRFRCQGCNKSFQLAYAYEAYKPGVKERIVDMAMNGSWVRECNERIPRRRAQATRDVGGIEG